MDNLKPIIKQVLISNWTIAQAKVYLWYYCMMDPRERETPKTSEDITKIYTKMGLSKSAFFKALHFHNLSITFPQSYAPKEEKEDEPTISSPEIKGLVLYWEERTGIKLSISDKISFLSLCSDVKIMERNIGNFVTYQEHFKRVTNVERMSAYLFRNSFLSFTANFEKYGDGFDEIFKEHIARYDIFKNKPVSFGFSSDPVEDKKIAMETELDDICFAIESGKTYEKRIMFPENLDYYTKKMKNLEKRRKKK